MTVKELMSSSVKIIENRHAPNPGFPVYSESCHKCPLENVLDKMSPSFGPPKKCPLDLVL
jgi:hypothetical protein